MNKAVGRILFSGNVRSTCREIQPAVGKRLKATAAPAVKAAATTVEDVEWARAKPFDQMPGITSLPVIGTSWAMFPVVGIFDRHNHLIVVTSD